MGCLSLGNNTVGLLPFVPVPETNLAACESTNTSNPPSQPCRAMIRDTKTDQGFDSTAAVALLGDSIRVVGAVDEGTYAEGDTISCESCTTPPSTFGFPPGAVAGREPEALPRSLAWFAESSAEQVGESPPRYAVTGALDGETLRVEVDDRLRVVGASRETA